MPNLHRLLRCLEPENPAQVYGPTVPRQGYEARQARATWPRGKTCSTTIQLSTTEHAMENNLANKDDDIVQISKSQWEETPATTIGKTTKVVKAPERRGWKAVLIRQ